MFGHKTFPRLPRGSNSIPLAPEASALTTELITALLPYLESAVFLKSLSKQLGFRQESVSIQHLVHLNLSINLGRHMYVLEARGGLVVNTTDSGSRGRGFEPHSGRRVVSLSKTYLPLKSTGNTQEALAPSQHD